MVFRNQHRGSVKIKNAVNLVKSRLTAEFLASRKGFEPPTPALGGAPGTPFGLKNRGKKSLEIIEIKGFESFWTDN